MRIAYLVSAVGVTLAFVSVGCVSLLGGFSTGTSASDDEGGTAETGAPSDGGAPSTDGVSPSDSPQDAPAALQLLTCNSWQNSSPTVLLQIPASDSGSENSPPFHQVYVEHLPSTNSARVVVSSSTSNSTDTNVFTVPEQGGGGVQSIVFPSTGLNSVARTANATVLFLQNYMGGMNSYYSVADTDPGNDTDAEAPLASIGSPPSQGQGNSNYAFVPTTANQFYTLAVYETTTSSYNVASWLAPTQSAWQLPLQGQTLAPQIGGALLANGTDVYGFFPPLGSPNAMGPTTIQQFTFAATAATAPTTRTITATGETAFPIAVGQASGGQYELAFIAITGAQTAGLRAGLVPASQINTFMVDSLAPLGFKPGGDAGFFDTTPLGGNNGPGGRWLSNGDFGIMGTGGTGGAGTYTGLNFYVGTPTGQWVIETAGTGQNVLPGHNVTNSAFDLLQAVSDILLSFDVAWAEELADGSTVLYFNQLKCQI
jgi:hypothetical protein